MKNKTSRELDKFYTDDILAEECLEAFLKVLKENNVNIEGRVFLEPSAGGGAFIRALENRGLNHLGVDIAPEGEKILRKDFLKEPLQVENPLVIGNPPFGKRSALALAFIEKSFEYSDYVGFILPIQFKKYLTQKKLPDNLKLIYSQPLPEDAFTISGKKTKVRCVFQVWSSTSLQKDLRTRKAPPVSHPDFEMRTYNCTERTRWILDSDYDFAVLRQGWGDFKPIDPGVTLNPSKQWMVFKSSNPETLKKLRKIDFEELSTKNTSVRGFGKADVVEEYKRLYD